MTQVPARYRTVLSGTGSYLPEAVLTNFDLEKMVDTHHDWIVERTGIHRRHIAAPHEATSDLAYQASRRALEAAGLTPGDLDMILLATVSPDQIMPNTACVLQRKLGAPKIMAVDLSAACSGFVYGLAIADQFIKTGVYKNILVVGTEVLSRMVDYTDRTTCILFGDGAGAAIASRARDDQPGDIFSVHLHADGQLGDLFELPGGGSVHPPSHEMLDQKLQFVRMKGQEIFKHAVRTMSQCCQEALDANQATKNDIDWVIPHQANFRILDAVAKHFGLPMEKVIVNLQETGNTSAASVPIALDQAIRAGKIQRGHKLMLAAFGAGITSGSIYLQY